MRSLPGHRQCSFQFVRKYEQINTAKAPGEPKPPCLTVTGLGRTTISTKGILEQSQGRKRRNDNITQLGKANRSGVSNVSTLFQPRTSHFAAAESSRVDFQLPTFIRALMKSLRVHGLHLPSPCIICELHPQAGFHHALITPYIHPNILQGATVIMSPQCSLVCVQGL